MKKIKIKRIVTAFILLLVLQPVVNAITIKPTVVEMSVEPGQKGSGHFFIQNNTTSKVLISVEPETFTGKNIDQWLQLSPRSFTLEANQSREVAYTVHMPADFKDEYIARVYFRQSPVNKNSKGSSIITRIGASFYVSARGKELLSPEVNDFKITSKEEKFFSQMNLKNNGNVHLRFFYDLAVHDEAGKEVYSRDKEHLTVVIPGSSKRISVPFITDDDLSSGNYSGTVRLYYGNIMPLTNYIETSSRFEVGK